MNSIEPSKTNARIRVKITEPIPNSEASKTITKKSRGGVNIMTLGEGENSVVNASPFDTFLQILDGSAEVIIEGISYILNAGHTMILRAHQANMIRANVNLKMIATEII